MQGWQKEMFQQNHFGRFFLVSKLYQKAEEKFSQSYSWLTFQGIIFRNFSLFLRILVLSKVHFTCPEVLWAKFLMLYFKNWVLRQQGNCLTTKKLQFFSFCFSCLTLSKIFSTELSKLLSICPEEHSVCFNLRENISVDAIKIGKSPDRKVYTLRERYSFRILQWDGK